MKKSTIVAAAFALHTSKTLILHLKKDSTPDKYWIIEEKLVPKPTKEVIFEFKHEIVLY